MSLRDSGFISAPVEVPAVAAVAATAEGEVTSSYDEDALPPSHSWDKQDFSDDDTEDAFAPAPASAAAAALDVAADADEEREILLFNAADEAEGLAYDQRAADARTQAFLAAGGDPSLLQERAGPAAASDDLASTLDRLNIGVPHLSTVMVEIVVEFWTGNEAEPEKMEFVAGTKPPLAVMPEKMHEFCTTPLLNPLMLRHVVRDDPEPEPVEDIVEDDDSDGESSSAATSASASATATDLSASQAVGPDFGVDGEGEDELEGVEPNIIPPQGRVNVIMVMHAQSPTIVGLLSEQYNMGLQQGGFDTGGTSEDVLDRISNRDKRGRRVLWLEGASGPTKRSRVEEIDDTSTAAAAATPDPETQAAEDADATMHQGVHTLFEDFAEEGAEEWTNVRNRHNIVLAFARDSQTGRLQEVRLGVSLHSPMLREELQGALAYSRDTI